MINAARECSFNPASTWSANGLIQIGQSSSTILTEFDYILTSLSGNTNDEIAFYWTVPSTPTPASTNTPMPASSLRGTVTEVSNCRYGPDWTYIYKYGLRAGTQMEAIGHDLDGDWLKIQAVGGNNPCWIKAAQMQVNGDVMTLPDAYPYTQGLPISPFFPQIILQSVSGGGGTVNVSWQGHDIRSDLQTGQRIEYIVEIWTCVSGKPTFLLDSDFRTAGDRCALQLIIVVA